MAAASPNFLTRNWFWFLVLGLTLLMLVAVEAILLPFVLGMLAAYFLDPATDRLERWGLSRTFATLLITTLFFLGIALLFALLVPLLINQVSELLSALPDYVTSLEVRYGPQFKSLFAQMGGGGKGTDAMREAAQSLSTSILGFMAGSVGGVLQSGLAVANLFALIFVTPVVAFYLLRDWDRLVAKVDDMLPRKHAKTIREQFDAIDQVLSGFIRGQTNVCIFLAVFYSITLSIAGLQYALALGLVTGFLTFIPYVGCLFGLALGMLLAFVQFGDFTHVAIISGIFLFGQFIEGNIVAPRLVGDKVGLHPVWIIFGLLAGGHMFGFLGVLIAVPVTAIIGVLMRYAAMRYKDSKYYGAPAR